MSKLAAEDRAPKPRVAEERAALKEAAVVSVATAARWLGGRQGDAAAWILGNVPTFTHPVTQERSVVWGWVVAKLEDLANGERLRATRRVLGTLEREEL